MTKILFPELLTKIVDDFSQRQYDDGVDALFEDGNVLEIMNAKGKELVKKSIVSTLEDNYNKVKEEARKLLITRETISALRRFFPHDETTIKYLDNQFNDVQEKYQEKYKEVIELEKVLSNFES